MKKFDRVFLLLRAGQQGNVWIAGTDLGTEGRFYWATTNQPVGPYDNYIPSTYPNNYGKNEHCLHYWHNKKWNDFHCDAKQRFICELIG
jgi:hypothetical protein